MLRGQQTVSLLRTLYNSRIVLNMCHFAISGGDSRDTEGGEQFWTRLMD